MNNYSQENSQLSVVAPSGVKGLVPTRMQGWEKLGDGFEFVVDLVTQAGNPIEFRQFLEKPMVVVLALPGNATRYFHGDVFKASVKGSLGDFNKYSVTLRPRIARLALIKRSRVYQNQNVKQILESVLEAVGGAEFQITRHLDNRLYCVQYRETDLEFFRRICSEAGLTYYWKHTLEDHRLVITSNTSECESEGIVAFDPYVGGTITNPTVWEWETEQELVNSRVDIRDSHHELSSKTIDSNVSLLDRLTVGEVSLELPQAKAPTQADSQSIARNFDLFNASGGFTGSSQGAWFDAQEDQTRLMAIAAKSRAVRARATGNAAHLQPGKSFLLEGLRGQNGSWLVVGQNHECHVEAKMDERDSFVLRVESRLEAAPLALEQLCWPPIRRPEVAVVLTARVTGPEGAETFVDPLGRIKIKFDWEREGATDGTSSCWVRVSQFWAGKSYGAFFWPRIGHEVLVAFEDGNPDRPIVIGSLYNIVNVPPCELPACSFISGVKSKLQGDLTGMKFQQIILSDDPTSPILHFHSDTQILMHQNREQQSTVPDSSFRMLG